jgi:F420-non-reducing hydrogenase iron-sulfur subunit
MRMARDLDVADFEPNVVVLYCQNCVAEPVDTAALLKDVSGFEPRLVVMPCSSKVEASHVLKLLDEGADGVQVVGCPENQCRFLVGSTMAEKRIEYARGLLDEVRMGADRLGMERGDRLSATQLTELAERRAAAVRPLGPNPMKTGSDR